jgi:hypothetical protein
MPDKINSCKALLVRLKENLSPTDSEQGAHELISTFWRPLLSTLAATLLIPEEAAPQFRDDVAPRNGMMSPPDSEMIAPPITE